MKNVSLTKERCICIKEETGYRLLHPELKKLGKDKTVKWLESQRGLTSTQSKNEKFGVNTPITVVFSS
jgi:hypothetical protein